MNNPNFQEIWQVEANGQLYETSFEELDKKIVIVDIAQIQKINYWNKDEIGGFEIMIDNYNQLDKIGEQIFEMVGTEFNSQTIKEVYQTIFSWLELQDVNAVIVIA